MPSDRMVSILRENVVAKIYVFEAKFVRLDCIGSLNMAQVSDPGDRGYLKGTLR